jgi:glycosyltransferase involved in cell wall biosynthesis
MRFHVLGMAHTQTTIEYTSCAYTQKIRNFCRMMMDRGHEVYLYAGEENDAPCTEHLVCITEVERKRAVKGHFHQALHQPDAPHWVTFNGRACGHLASRARAGDFLCVIFGFAQKPVADAFPILKTVEYGVGYHHTFASHRVFESYAWMHSIYAADKKTSDVDGIFYDGVIHGYLDPSQFHLAKKKEDYLLYMGRMIDRKGVRVAVEIAQAAGRRLVGAGPGTPPPGMHHLGEVGAKRRATLLAKAHAAIMPTLYVEPFGNVAIEAMASGTPVITTDWGAFTETVKHGVTGFRCRILQEFLDAIEMADTLDPKAIRKYAIDNFSLNVIGVEYDNYFKRLKTLWGKGWSQLREPPPAAETAA